MTEVGTRKYTVIIAGYRNGCGCTVWQRLVAGSIQYCNDGKVLKCVFHSVLVNSKNINQRFKGQQDI